MFRFLWTPGAGPLVYCAQKQALFLRVLLKAKTDDAEVAPKLIATSADLDALAGGQRDVAALKGWRREVFGNDALQLCEGKVGLAVKGQKVVTVAL